MKRKFEESNKRILGDLFYGSMRPVSNKMMVCVGGTKGFSPLFQIKMSVRMGLCYNYFREVIKRIDDPCYEVLNNIHIYINTSRDVNQTLFALFATQYLGMDDSIGIIKYLIVELFNNKVFY
jgi:hypothetical protein